MEAGINIGSHYGDGTAQEGSHDADAPLAPTSVSVLGDTGGAGSIEVIRLEDLSIDPVYQRELSNDLVEKIAAAWDMAVAGPISVSRRPNGSLWIIDGGHRAGGAARSGETEILARVFSGLTRVEEAAFRLKGNIRRSDKPYERFKAKLAAEDPESLAIRDICTQFGTRINPYPMPDAGINSVSAIEVLYKIDQGLLLTRVFEVLQEAFNVVGGPSANVAMLKSVAFWLERHPDAQRARWIEKLTEFGPQHLTRVANNHRSIHGGAMWVNYYRAMVEAYNQRLQPSNMVELRLGKAGQAFGGKTNDTGKARGAHNSTWNEPTSGHEQ